MQGMDNRYGGNRIADRTHSFIELVLHLQIFIEIINTEVLTE
jgi:hypothetical protein